MERFSKGMMTGFLIGVAVEMSLMPRMDRRSQKTMRRAGRRMRNMAESACHEVYDWMR
ncbi:YtxH domain-containing protein [Clostridium beijerinckii]|uniref:Gas vesicle protein n=1 Tax=Clostridium beijerinckii TaxID=1520 RepID=A0A1W7LLR8_CLOBE|nr:MULTISPECIES: YtxH domain-containing protein [Clostridium]MBA8937593.1 gas vesicle protein [Clostridium beijerinckii]MBN7572861.1 YtxH domain-containing protein [Clostridium beijerinckii]MBN7578337.1 YtxH domain-containing protein [Clostridium beijerinckii]MBN7582635.1 YtxH domain-containing protein [Clostridium beijerinckii]MBO0521957.1 YtxH domain-containing protein [Clostridium beijerinckii]